MLAHNNKTGVIVQPNSETPVCSWISDGSSYLIGFTGCGSYTAEYLLYVGDEPWYRYWTSPGNRTAYVADRGTKVPAGTVVELRVLHEDPAAQTYYGTLLGGA